VIIDFKFQSLGKISNISAADPPVLLGQFQHWIKVIHFGTNRFLIYDFLVPIGCQ